MGLSCRECVALIKELGAPVEFIVLPTFAYEHKVFVAPMSRQVPPGQGLRRSLVSPALQVSSCA